VTDELGGYAMLNTYYYKLLIGLIGIFYIGIFVLCFGCCRSDLGLSVGDTVMNIPLKLEDKTETWIPGWGKKLILIYYSDVESIENNSLLRKIIEKRNYSPRLFESVEIINSKDSNNLFSVLQLILKQKILHSVPLIDLERSLSNHWNLGTCNDEQVIILVNKNQKVLFVKKKTLTGDDIIQLLIEINKALGIY